MAGTATLAKKQTKSKKKGRNKMTLALLSMMLPGFIYLLINNYIPMAGLVIAFKRFNYSKGIWGSDWCGFSNFTYLFRTLDTYPFTVQKDLIFIDQESAVYKGLHRVGI